MPVLQFSSRHAGITAALASILIVVELVVGVGHADAWGRVHVFGPHVFVGPRVFIGPDPWWYASPYVPPPVVVEPPPTVYVEPPATPPPAPSVWYYCEESRGYYPYVAQCPKGWTQVVPKSTLPTP